jgi:hypothetical protein
VPAQPTADGLLDILERALHANRTEWIFLRELRVATGRRNGGVQRLDAFALNCFHHQAMKRICYEVKVSRADFLGEMKNPVKRRAGMRYSNEFYFVTPGGLIDVTELPVECGLIEAGPATPDEFQALLSRHSGFFHYDPEAHTYCILRVAAPWRDTPGPTWELVAAMLRNQRRLFEEKPPPPPAQQRFALE